MAFLLGEGGEERLGTNVNYLLEEYGMTVHKDSVVRTHWRSRFALFSYRRSGHVHYCASGMEHTQIRI